MDFLVWYMRVVTYKGNNPTTKLYQFFCHPRGHTKYCNPCLCSVPRCLQKLVFSAKVGVMPQRDVMHLPCSKAVARAIELFMYLYLWSGEDNA